MQKGNFFGLFVISVFLFPIVKAARLDLIETTVRDVIDSTLAFSVPFFEAILGEYYSSEFFFAKVLLLILLFVVMRFAISSIPNLGKSKAVVISIALVSSLFAVRFISYNQLTQGILLPYGVLGVALATILPFVIYFFFVHKSIESGAGRKLAWIFYFVVMSAFWFSRSNELSNLENYLYGGTLALAAILFFFDEHIKTYFGKIKIEKDLSYINKDHIVRLLKKYHDTMDVYNKTGDSTWLDHANRIRQNLISIGHRF